MNEQSTEPESSEPASEAEASSVETDRDDETPGKVKTGPQIIQAFAKKLPNNPGVYRMYNVSGDVLYVGKARSLKKRVTNYTRMMGQTNRIARMISETAGMEFVSTRTETEALLLEANLIKRFRPKYNVLLRDDKSFPYIHIAEDHEAPQLLKHRGARKGKGSYFGPFASAGSVNRTITALQKAFLLRNCSDSYYENRTRPCLQFQIKRCSGPCTGEISSENYAELVKEAKAFLSGKSQKVQQELAGKMEAASEELNFETAAIYRDRLSALSHIQSQQGINPQTVREADVFALHQQDGQTCIQVFFFRTGQNWGNRAYFPKADETLEPGFVLEAFLTQFYDDKPAPAIILLSHLGEEHELLSAALTERMGHKVHLSKPQRGEKRDLVSHAMTNAREALGRKQAETSSQQKLLRGVQEVFDLSEMPRRIEVYDNSHIMGTNAVGGMIVAGVDGFLKNQYRKFNIKSQDITPGDDYGMMREVLTRRFSRLLKETDGPNHAQEDDAIDAGTWPDLLLIDGGIGQINAVKAVLEELGVADMPIAGVAKGPDRDAGREKFIVPGRAPFMLPERDPVLYFIQRMRDEAHRFAIGSHRARRKRDIGKNPLDEIPGIGPTRKRAILHHFGTAKAASKAGLSDLEKVPGVSAQMAQIIFDFFHDTGKISNN
jgi:excinuclease ABC subunit C